MPFIIAIDYSMSCPAITITSTETNFKFETCNCFYLSEKIPKTVLPNITGTRLPEYSDNNQRFDLIANWSLETIVKRVGVTKSYVFIEGYSMGSKGQVFNIGENTGILKNKLWNFGFDIFVVPPTVIKKFATGKGTATKEKMYESFVEKTKVNLMALYQPKAEFVGSPVGDIVDSYFLCEFGCVNVNKYL